MTPRKSVIFLSLICVFTIGALRVFAQESQDNNPNIRPRVKPTPTPQASPRATPQPAQEPSPQNQQGESSSQDQNSAQGESSSKDATIDPNSGARPRPEVAPAANDEKAFRPYDPHRAAKDLEVGNFYLKQKNYRAALERFNDALLYKPDDADSIYGLAVTQDKLDLPEKARKNYSKYLEILPHGPHAKECEEALKRLETREASAPADSAAAQSARDLEAGETFLTRNQYDAARERFEDAMRLTPDNPLISFRLAQALQGMQRLEPARSYYQKYLQLAPKGPYAGDAKRAIADINWIVGK